jgi:hypothetical protein
LNARKGHIANFFRKKSGEKSNINRAARPRHSPIARCEIGSILAANAANYAGFAGFTDS